MVLAVVTVKLVDEDADAVPTVTVIAPVVAPVGTEVVIVVAVEAVTCAVVPLNFTMLLAAVVLKLVPVMVTAVPTAPLPGVKLLMVGVVVLAVVTVKLLDDVPVFVPTITVTFPVVAPVGTVVVIDVEVEAVTVAATPLNFTILLASNVLKLVPVMVTAVPTAPLVGVKPVTVGVGTTTAKFNVHDCPPNEIANEAVPAALGVPVMI